MDKNPITHPSFTYPPSPPGPNIGNTRYIPIHGTARVRTVHLYTPSAQMLHIHLPCTSFLFPSSTCAIYLIRSGTFSFPFLVSRHSSRLLNFSTLVPIILSDFLFSLLLAPPASQTASNWRPDPHPIFAPTPRLTDLVTGAATPTLDLDLHFDLLDHSDLVFSLGLVMFI